MGQRDGLLERSVRLVRDAQREKKGNWYHGEFNDDLLVVGRDISAENKEICDRAGTVSPSQRGWK